MSQLDELIELLSAAYRPDFHRELLEALWSQERWFDASHQRVAAELAAGVLKGAGLSDVELQPYSTNGRTKYQDWITRLSWECPRAWLRVADEESSMLAHRESCPAAVVMGSGPLGSVDGPLRGPLIDIDAERELAPETLRGAFLLTGRTPHEVKSELCGISPAAIVSDFQASGFGYDDDTTTWINAWADDPDGWYLHADDSRIAGFMLSPAMGRGLRERLARQPELELEGLCESKLFAGEGQCVTALLEGTRRDQEVWIFGHGCEQGASDNCSGVSTLVVAISILETLVRQGALPRPRRSVRLIVTEECLGMVAFATLHDDLRQRALCGLNVDAVGDLSSIERPFNLMFGPLSNPSFGWPVAGILGETLVQRFEGRWFLRSAPFVPTADDMIADPACGIPTLWLGHGKEALGYHSSADIPENCAEESLEAASLFTAAWAYTMASLDDLRARALIEPSRGWLQRVLVRESQDRSKEDHIALRQWVVSEALEFDLGSPASSFPKGEWGLGRELGEERYQRLTWGTMTLETIAPELRPGISRWSEAQQAFLYWLSRGESRQAAEILARAEVGEVDSNELELLLELGLEAGCLKRL